MKRIITAIFLVIFTATFSVAGFWCQRDGDVGINCQSDSKGYLLIDGFKVKTAAIANLRGYYIVVDTMPTVSSIQERTTEIWGFETDHFTRTWNVETLSTTEQNERTAAAMPLGEYWLWKALILTGTITQTQAQNVLPTELIQAYQAREALEEE